MRISRLDKTVRPGLGALLATTLIGLLAAPASEAADVYLVAKAFDKNLPDGTSLRMWGFAEDADGDLNTDDGEAATAPGPVLSVPAADAGLTIHLRNDLAVPTSVIVPGQQTTDNPVMFNDAQGRQRVRSFVHETAPGAISSYSYPALRPGTFLYQSGTHPALQVQMGLAGAGVKDAAAGEAYPGVVYDHEVILVYSEIDPALQAAVADGSYGTPAYPSTVDYRPRYFLINGQTYDPNAPPLDAGTAGQTVLLRFVNVGLKTHAPMLQRQWVEMIAEDGHPYSRPRPQTSLMVAAGQTRDALWTPPAAVETVVWDRRLYLTDAGAAPGGMQVRLQVVPPGAQTLERRETELRALERPALERRSAPRELAPASAAERDQAPSAERRLERLPEQR